MKLHRAALIVLVPDSLKELDPASVCSLLAPATTKCLFVLRGVVSDGGRRVHIAPFGKGPRDSREIDVQGDALGLPEEIVHRLQSTYAPPVTVFALSSELPLSIGDGLTEYRCRAAIDENSIPFWKLPLWTISEKDKPQLGTISNVLPHENRLLRDFLREDNGPILLEGPTGTGKTQTAHRIHLLTRRGKLFRPINCGPLQDNEREALFRGVRKGGFTGVTEAPSVFKAHDGGTVLLDDFQSCSPSNQTTLLDLLRPSSCRIEGYHLGDTSSNLWTADVQVILAINEPVGDLLRTKALRRDILARVRRRYDPLKSLRDVLASGHRDKQRDYLRLVLLEMQERSLSLHVQKLEGDPGTRDPHSRFLDALSLMEDGGYEEGGEARLLPRFPQKFRDHMPIPDALLDYTWPENFRELESLARALYRRQGQIASWSEDLILEELKKRMVDHGDAAGGPPSADPGGVKANAASPVQLLARAYLCAIQGSRTLRQAARELLIDPRTLQKMLTAAKETPVNSTSEPRGQLGKMLTSLTALERQSFLEAATAMLEKSRKDRDT